MFSLAFGTEGTSKPPFSLLVASVRLLTSFGHLVAVAQGYLPSLSVPAMSIDGSGKFVCGSEIQTGPLRSQNRLVFSQLNDDMNGLQMHGLDSVLWTTPVPEHIRDCKWISHSYAYRTQMRQHQHLLPHTLSSLSCRSLIFAAGNKVGITQFGAEYCARDMSISTTCAVTLEVALARVLILRTQHGMDAAQYCSLTFTRTRSESSTFARSIATW